MAELKTITSDQMRTLEQTAIRSGEVTGLELMERAGRGVVEAIFEQWPERRHSPERAVVICGPGNNGGDGFVIARLLKLHGWSVSVYLFGDPSKLPPDARTNYEHWLELQDVRDEMQAMSEIDGAEDSVIIDALFGIGLSRPIKRNWREIIDKCGLYECSVAVDLPSGFDSDTGEIIDYPPSELATKVPDVDARRISHFDLTVTFHRPKPAHLIVPCMGHCGNIVVKDIGL